MLQSQNKQTWKHSFPLEKESIWRTTPDFELLLSLKASAPTKQNQRGTLWAVWNSYYKLPSTSSLSESLWSFITVLSVKLTAGFGRLMWKCELCLFLQGRGRLQSGSRRNGYLCRYRWVSAGWARCFSTQHCFLVSLCWLRCQLIAGRENRLQ